MQVSPDRDDWTYKTGAPATFKILVMRDGHPLPGATVSYSYGPEMLPAKVEKTAPVPKEGLVVAAGTMNEPGFLRLVATAEVDGKKFRGLATAGFAPEAIKPTVEDPPDFDAFWAASKEALAKLPIDAKLTLLADLSTPKVDVYHVSLQNVGRRRRRARAASTASWPSRRDRGRFPRCWACPARAYGPTGEWSSWPRRA